MQFNDNSGFHVFDQIWTINGQAGTIFYTHTYSWLLHSSLIFLGNRTNDQLLIISRTLIQDFWSILSDCLPIGELTDNLSKVNKIRGNILKSGNLVTLRLHHYTLRWIYFFGYKKWQKKISKTTKIIHFSYRESTKTKFIETRAFGMIFRCHCASLDWFGLSGSIAGRTRN